MSDGEKIIGGCIVAVGTMTLLFALAAVLGLGMPMWYAWWLQEPIRQVTGWEIPYWRLTAALAVWVALRHRVHPQATDEGFDGKKYATAYGSSLIAPMFTYYIVRWMLP